MSETSGFASTPYVEGSGATAPEALDDATYQTGTYASTEAYAIPSVPSSDSGQSKTDAAKQAASETASTAKDQAAEVKSTAVQAGTQVASTAKEQGQQVVAEAAAQARDLLGEVRSQATSQAGTQKDKAVGGVRSLASELEALINGEGGQSGIATEFARQASSRLQDVATWVESREPGDLLDEARDFARRKPGTFLLGAAVAGILVGRATRGTIAAVHESSDSSGPSADETVTYPSSNAYVSPGTTYPPGTLPVDTDASYVGSAGYAGGGLMDTSLETVDVRPETTGAGYGARP